MLYGAGMVLFLLNWPVNAANNTAKDIGPLAYNSMFQDSTKVVQQVTKLINLCKNLSNGFWMELPKKGAAPGVLVVRTYDAPFNALKKTLTSPKQENIFKSTLFHYSRDLEPSTLLDFLNKPNRILRFLSKQDVYGKYGTRFRYAMHSEFVKSPGWLMERDILDGNAQRIKGLAGDLQFLAYFTIISSLSPDKTLRIVATWNDAGGNIPLIGNIRAKPEDIREGIEKGYKDVADYLRATTIN